MNAYTMYDSWQPKEFIDVALWDFDYIGVLCVGYGLFQYDFVNCLQRNLWLKNFRRVQQILTQKLNTAMQQYQNN